MNKDKEEPICPECGSTNVLDLDGKLVCDDCGNEWTETIQEETI